MQTVLIARMPRRMIPVRIWPRGKNAQKLNICVLKLCSFMACSDVKSGFVMAG
jgi:hypothetical protein